MVPGKKGITYDLVKMFETFLNERLGTGHVKLHVVLIPVEFDQLLEGLRQGYGDIAAAGLSITPARDELVDFGSPLSHEVRELLITGPAAPQLDGLDDLSGQASNNSIKGFVAEDFHRLTSRMHHLCCRM